jgi:hypothetical protein
MTRKDYARLNAELAELGAYAWHQLSPAFASGPRRNAARERRGRSRVKLLRQRHSRGDFGQRELDRRTIQVWQSI